MKSYTDIEQSRVLAKILPLESADMHYTLENFVDEDTGDVFSIEKAFLGCPYNNKEIGCWSLAALFGVLPEYNLQRTDWRDKTEYKIVVTINEDNYASKNYNNPLDACYKLILKLNELKML